MREAKRLQAAATAKYDQAEALLAQYGLADVPAQPTPAPEASQGGSNRGSSGYERSQLHHINKDSRESAPSPMLPHGGPCTKRGHADCVGCFMPSATSIQARA